MLVAFVVHVPMSEECSTHELSVSFVCCFQKKRILLGLLGQCSVC